MMTGHVSDSSGFRSSPQVWLPGMTRVPPFSAVKSVAVQMNCTRRSRPRWMAPHENGVVAVKRLGSLPRSNLDRRCDADAHTSAKRAALVANPDVTRLA